MFLSEYDELSYSERMLTTNDETALREMLKGVSESAEAYDPIMRAPELA